MRYVISILSLFFLASCTGSTSVTQLPSSSQEVPTNTSVQTSTPSSDN